MSPLEFTGGGRPALQIPQFVVVVPALASAPFGMPAIAFWMYVCASLLFIIGLIKIFGELPQEHGVDKIMPFGRLFFAIPLAVFGSEHFTITADIASLVPRDRKSTRLNSSHQIISYAVFCLKKKKPM